MIYFIGRLRPSSNESVWCFTVDKVNNVWRRENTEIKKEIESPTVLVKDFGLAFIVRNIDTIFFACLDGWLYFSHVEI